VIRRRHSGSDLGAGIDARLLPAAEIPFGRNQTNIRIYASIQWLDALLAWSYWGLRVPVTPQPRQDGPGGVACYAQRVAGISPKTCDHHMQRLHGKAGVSTGAGATLSALEHGLVRLDEAFAAWRARAPNLSRCAELATGVKSC
jgi:hypothetical protein